MVLLGLASPTRPEVQQNVTICFIKLFDPAETVETVQHMIILQLTTAYEKVSQASEIGKLWITCRTKSEIV